jgi:hypothetical protein
MSTPKRGRPEAAGLKRGWCLWIGAVIRPSLHLSGRIRRRIQTFDDAGYKKIVVCIIVNVFWPPPLYKWGVAVHGDLFWTMGQLQHRVGDGRRSGAAFPAGCWLLAACG